MDPASRVNQDNNWMSGGPNSPSKDAESGASAAAAAAPSATGREISLKFSSGKEVTVTCQPSDGASSAGAGAGGRRAGPSSGGCVVS